MSSREPSLSEFLEWVNRLDDSYKIFLFSIINALFYFILMVTGQNVDPDSIKEAILGTLIESLGIPALTSIWVNVAQPILVISGIIQIGISVYAIWKFRILGIVVASLGFVGAFMLFSTSHFGWPIEVAYLAIGMIFVSYVIARRNSNLNFDSDGRVIYD